MHQPPESTAAAAAAAADISARKMAHPAMFPRRGSGGGSASALSAAGTGVGSSAPSSEDFPPPSLLQPPPPVASSLSGPQPPPPQSLNLLSQAQLQAQPLAPGGTQMKKKSGFQITSVTPAQISASISSNNSIAEDTESYDDLDESHTEDLSSSEILDVSLSRATDLGEPERSSSEETLNNFQEAETPGAVSPNQPHLPQPHLPSLPQQNVVINGNAHPHPLHHHHHIHHGHHLHHGHHHPSHAGVTSTSIPGGPPSSPGSRKLSTTGSSDTVMPAAPTSAVSSGGSPAPVMPSIRASSTTGSIGINSVPGTSAMNNVNLAAVGSFNPSVTSSMLGNASVSASGIPSAAGVNVGPIASGGVNVNLLSGMGNGTLSSSAAVNSAASAAAGVTVGSSQQQQPAVNTSRFRVVKLDSSSEPFKKGRWTCTEFYEKENAGPPAEGVVINKAVETVKQNPPEVTSERESTSGSSVSSSVSTLSHYTDSVGSGEMGAPAVVQLQQPPPPPPPAALQAVALPPMDFGSSVGAQSLPAGSVPPSVSQPQVSQVQLQPPPPELSYQQKQGLQPVPVQAALPAAPGVQPTPVGVVGVTPALGQQPSVSSLAQPQLPYSPAAPAVQAPLPGAPPHQLQYGQQPPPVSTQMAPSHGTTVTPNPPSEYVQPPLLQTAVPSGQPAPAGVAAGAPGMPLAQPPSIQLPVQPAAGQAQPAGASGQPVGQAQTAVSAVPPGSQIANIGQQASIPAAVQQPSPQVTPAVLQQGAPPPSHIVPPAQAAILHQGVQTSASSLPQQLVIAPQSTLLTVPPQPPGVESVAQGIVSQQLPAVSSLPSASSISVTSQVSSTGPSGMPSAPTNLVPSQNIAQAPATQNGNLVQSVSQPPLIASNINLPLAQQIPLSSTQFSAQSLAQAIGSQIEDARRPAEPSLVGLPQTISGDSGGMSAVSDGSSSSLAASASLFPLKVLPLTTPLVDGEDESSSGASVVAIDNKIEQAMDLQKLRGAGRMELQDPKMNGALPRGAVDYRQEREGFLPSHSPAPGRKPTQFMDFEGKTSFGMSVFNLSNAIMGSGILGLAYAMAHTGVLFFLALLLCIALLSSYSIHLLLTCAGVVGIRAYEQLGQRALGPAGKVVVAAVICLHNVGAMSSYLFIIKSELPLVIGTFLDMDPEGDWFLKGNLLIIIVSVLIILPLALMRHLGYLGYTSGLSLTCMLFFLISVIYKKFQLGCVIGHNETAVESKGPSSLPTQGLNTSCEAQMFTADSQMFYTVPIMAFAFVCHPEVLPIYTELCRPSKRRMQAVANVSIGAMFCMYALTATFGYLTFYSSVEAEMLHMYSQQDLLILCVRLAVLLAVTLTVPVVLFPIRRALQQLLFPSKAFSWPRHVAIALILLVLVNVLVICVPTIRDIFGVIGSTSAPSLIFILPSIFYLRIVPSEVEPLYSWPKIQALCFGVLGVLFMAISLGFMFANWATGQSHVSGH